LENRLPLSHFGSALAAGRLYRILLINYKFSRTAPKNG
jgi:hypothetical protein